MSGQVEMTNPVDTSVGGMRGHLLRRGVHLSMIGIPYLYFVHGENVADALGLSLPQVVSSVVLIALVLESVRLKLGLTVFGQRDYEAKQVSALAWGAIGVGFVLLLVPHEAYAWPLIASLALGDPFMGNSEERSLPTAKSWPMRHSSSLPSGLSPRSNLAHRSGWRSCLPRSA